MIVTRRSKAAINFKVVDMLVRNYLSLMQGISISGTVLSELFRVSICDILGLPYMCNTQEVCRFLGAVKSTLRPIIDTTNLMMATTETKQGYLEACVHCLEMSRLKAGV